MIFGLFRRRHRTSVHAAVGAPLVRESAWPRAFAPLVEPDWPPVRKLGVDAPPPAGVIGTHAGGEPPADAFLLPAAAGRPPLAFVNTYDTPRRCTLWELDAQATRFVRERPLAFDATQAAWLMFSAASVLALPDGQVLIHLSTRQPRIANLLFVHDGEGGAPRLLSGIEPDASRGPPFAYVETLQVAPQAVLVLYRTGNERIGPQRYVNHHDHVLLFSPRHRDGLEILTLGLDDGAIRAWGMAGGTLWLEASDDRGGGGGGGGGTLGHGPPARGGAPPPRFLWSLDLQRLLPAA
jgi:hypothetical protein